MPKGERFFYLTHHSKFDIGRPYAPRTEKFCVGENERRNKLYSVINETNKFNFPVGVEMQVKYNTLSAVAKTLKMEAKQMQPTSYRYNSKINAPYSARTKQDHVDKPRTYQWLCSARLNA